MRLHLPLVSSVLMAALLAAGGASATDVVFRDDFSNPASGWPTRGQEADQIIGFMLYSDGEYQVSPTANGTLGIAMAPRQAATPDVSVAAKTWVYAGVGAGGAGVACRRASREQFYAFLLTGGNGWAIIKFAKDEGGTAVLAKGPLRSAPLIPGMLDARVEARCEGDRLDMLVDGQRVGSARDAAYKTGGSGLVVIGEKGGGTNARFDDFELRSMP